MRTGLFGLAAMAALSVGALSMQAAPASAELVRYEAAYVFGDSLSDPGNLFALVGEPGFPYFEGQLSDGPVWATYLARDFADAGQTFRNYAFAAARVITPPPEDAPLPIHLDHQLARFLDDAQAGVPSRSVAMAWIGSTDSFRIVSNAGSQVLAGTPIPIAIFEAVLAAEALAAQLLSKLSVLAPAGVRDLVLFNLPDLGRIPAYAGTEGAPLASLVAAAFNARLAVGTVDGLNVRRFDVAGLFDALLDDPQAFGVSSLEPCFVTEPVVSLCLDPEARAFFDPLHPGSTIHARLADEVRTMVAPIPLPAGIWLLLAGLAGLGAVRLRRVG